MNILDRMREDKRQIVLRSKNNGQDWILLSIVGLPGECIIQRFTNNENVSSDYYMSVHINRHGPSSIYRYNKEFPTEFYGLTIDNISKMIMIRKNGDIVKRMNALYSSY